MTETVSTAENGNGSGAAWNVLEVCVRNWGAVKMIRWTPTELLNVIAGENGAGKSWFMDAIESVFDGGFPGVDVVRHGEDEAEVFIHLSDGFEAHLYITKTASNPDKWELAVRKSIGGKKEPSPKTIVDKIKPRLLDPSKLARCTPQERIDMMLKAIGLGDALKTIEEAEKKFVREREDVGRDRRNKIGELEGIPFPPLDTPDELLDTADLVRQKNDMEAGRAANQKKRQGVDYWKGMRDVANAKVKDTEARISALRDEVRRLEIDLETQRDQACTDQDSYMAAKSEADALVDPDLTEVDNQLSNSKTINATIANKQRWQRVAKERDALTEKWEGIDSQVKALSTRKAELLASASWPYPGMGFGNGDLTVNDCVWNNLSEGEKVKVSTAVAFALNPTLKLALLSEGVWLSKASIKIVYDMAKAHKVKVLIERQETDEAADSIIIEDGAVVGAEETELEPEVVS